MQHTKKYMPLLSFPSCNQPPLFKTYDRNESFFSQYSRANPQIQDNRSTTNYPDISSCEVSFNCDTCTATLPTLELFILHRRKKHKFPSSFRFYKCDICNALFGKKGARNKHKIQKHTESDKWFSCEEPGCLRKFERYLSMKRHKQIMHDRHRRMHVNFRSFQEGMKKQGRKNSRHRSDVYSKRKPLHRMSIKYILNYDPMRD